MKIHPAPLERPQMFAQPKRPTFTKNGSSASSIDRLLRRIADPAANGRATTAYEELLQTYQPAVQWVMASWDFLVTVDGFRYVLRTPWERNYCHGDYRTFIQPDLSRLTHKIFRQCVEEFSTTAPQQHFTAHLHQHFWPRIRSSYAALKYPEDPRQRLLTDFSYLRCVPYRFLNRYHQLLVSSAIDCLPRQDRLPLELYFFKFFTDEATARALNVPPDDAVGRRERAVRAVGGIDRTVQSLLLQIARY